MTIGWEDHERQKILEYIIYLILYNFQIFAPGLDEKNKPSESIGKKKLPFSMELDRMPTIGSNITIRGRTTSNDDIISMDIYLLRGHDSDDGIRRKSKFF